MKELLAFLARKGNKRFEKSLKQAFERERFHESTLPLSQLEGFWQILEPTDISSSNSHFLSRFLGFLATKYFRWSSRLELPVLKEGQVLFFQSLLGSIFTDQLWLFALAYECGNYLEPRLRKYISQNWKEFVLPPVDEPFLLSLRKKGFVEVHRHLSGSLLPL
ncbi:MAG: hypothetical protein GXO01_06870, partial [Epsilonproteobacteria bacterium]|nr:hypothetical protein [Campylobacterota bacterium]